MQILKYRILLPVLVAFIATNASAADKKVSPSNTLSVPITSIKLDTEIKSKAVQSVKTKKSVRTKNTRIGNRVTPYTKPKPGTGVRIKQVGKNASAARDAANIKYLQQMKDMRKGAGAAALDPKRQDNSPAANTALGGRTFDHKNPADALHRQGGFNAQNCIGGASNCFSTNGGNRRGGIHAQPSAKPAGTAKLDRRGIASGDGKETSEQLPTESTDVTANENTYENGDGSQTHVTEKVNSKGDVIGQEVTVTHADGSFDTRVYDGNKHLIVSTHGVTGGVVTDGPGSKSRSGMPREDGRTNGSGGCNWNPIYGRCMNKRTSKKDMTSQPGRNSSGSSASATPRLGREAVTNSGDAGYRSAASRGGAGAKPYNGVIDPKLTGSGGTLPGPGSK